MAGRLASDRVTGSRGNYVLIIFFTGSAIGGSDFRLILRILNFDEKCLNIQIIDDDVVEGAETFSVLLVITAGNVTPGNSVTIVTIIDNDNG